MFDRVAGGIENYSTFLTEANVLIFFFMESPGHHLDFMFIFSRGVGRRRVM